MRAKGATPADSSPLTFIAGDLAYQVEADVEIDPGAEAGLVLFYNRRMYCGLAFNKDRLVMYRTAIQRPSRKPEGAPTPMRRLRLRATNDRHIVTFHYALEGGPWRKFEVQMEVSGYHHNTAYDFLSLRPGIFVAGAGGARFRNLTYRALETKGGDHGA